MAIAWSVWHILEMFQSDMSLIGSDMSLPFLLRRDR